MTDADPNTAGSWRTATEFSQAERYSPDTPDAPEAPGRPARRSLTPVFLGGGAMIGATVLLLMIGAPGWAAALVGLALFLGVVLGLSKKPVAAPTAAPFDEAAFAQKLTAAGLTREAFEETSAAVAASLSTIEMAAAGLSQPAHRQGLNSVVAAGRRILAALRDDPGDLRRVRKFLKVYVPSAEAAVRKFADFGVENDPELDAKFAAMIAGMNDACARCEDALMRDDKIDLETEIDVLAERLAQER